MFYQQVHCRDEAPKVRAATTMVSFRILKRSTPWDLLIDLVIDRLTPRKEFAMYDVPYIEE